MTETVNMPQLAPRDRCTGCGACSSGCPKGAIRMVPDKEGFLYPEITDGCVQCGHCTHVCPVLKQREHRTAPQVFAVWNRDPAVRRESTSGGAFSALAEYVLEGGGVVFAPTPRDYSMKLNKKEKRAALKSALSSRVAENKFIVIDEMNFGEIKTKNFQNMLNSLNVNKALVVLEDGNVNAELSARNIADVKTARTNTINVFDILKYNTVIATKAAVANIEEVYA